MEKSRIKKEEDSLSIDIKEESDSEASVIVDFCPQDINPPSIAVKREDETEQASSPPVPRRNLRKRNPAVRPVDIELPSESDEETKQKRPKKRREKVTTKKATGRSKKAEKNKSDGSDIGIWALDAKKKVAVRKFKGQTYIDIREFWMNDEGIQFPGKKGIALTPPAWNKLKTLVAEIDGALKKVDLND